MTVEEIEIYMKLEWLRVRKDLVEGRYNPVTTLRVGVEKPLEIQEAVDWLIHLAIQQATNPVFDRDPEARVSRWMQQAVDETRQYYIEQDHQWVQDIDLEKFFNRVNNDIPKNSFERRDRVQQGIYSN